MMTWSWCWGCWVFWSQACRVGWVGRGVWWLGGEVAGLRAWRSGWSGLVSVSGRDRVGWLVLGVASSLVDVLYGGGSGRSVSGWVVVLLVVVGV
jgi:hypothetical protein